MDSQNFEHHEGEHGQGQHQGVKDSNKKNKKLTRFVLFVIAVAVVATGLYYAYNSYYSKSSTASPAASFFANKYFAVFLDNGDVYFGKISNKESTFVMVDDAFYLKVTQVTQKNNEGKSVDVPQLNLVKLGNEVHKPIGKIEIQRSHIVSIQELAPDSEAITVMKNYK